MNGNLEVNLQNNVQDKFDEPKGNKSNGIIYVLMTLLFTGGMCGCAYYQQPETTSNAANYFKSLLITPTSTVAMYGDNQEQGCLVWGDLVTDDKFKLEHCLVTSVMDQGGQECWKCEEGYTYNRFWMCVTFEEANCVSQSEKEVGTDECSYCDYGQGPGDKKTVKNTSWFTSRLMKKNSKRAVKIDANKEQKIYTKKEVQKNTKKVIKKTTKNTVKMTTI